MFVTDLTLEPAGSARYELSVTYRNVDEVYQLSSETSVCHEIPSSRNPVEMLRLSKNSISFRA